MGQDVLAERVSNHFLAYSEIVFRTFHNQLRGQLGRDASLRRKIMFVELHVIQNFAPSNLNRDDTGSPKECLFGGYRRARISSQCFKRAMREMFEKGSLFTDEQKRSLADRSRLLVDEITKRLVKAEKPETESRDMAEAILNACKLIITEENQTEYLIFLGEKEIQALTNHCIAEWEALQKIVHSPAFEKVKELRKKIFASTEVEPNANDDEKGARSERSKLKKQLGEANKAMIKFITKDKQAKEIHKATVHLLDGGKAADLALFGRMLADLPEKNIDAASQVAHAISTHKSGVEFDFYTAVDDLLPHGETGAGMMGTVEFNSACFYRYANLDLGQLNKNLEDAKLEQATTEAFIRAFIEAVPTGKQHSTAPQQKPAFVLAVVREMGLCSLANAFANPVPTNRGELVQESIARLDKHWGELAMMYGTKEVKGQYFAALNVDRLEKLGERVKPTDGKTMIDTLVANVLQAINSSNQIQAKS
jgi:CRISPR system Cascade subunit CasC